MGESPETRDATVLGQWALALVPAIMLAVLLLRATTNSDMFWQLTLGQLTLAHGGPITRELFSAPHLGEPAPTLAWGGQAIMALAHGIAGWPGLRLIDAACWCGGFWAVAAACRRIGASALVLSAAMGLGFMAALPTAILRPQSFAVLCFGLLLALVALRPRLRVTVLLGTPLLVVWQNLHPSVSVAAGVLGVLAGVGWLMWCRDNSSRKPVAESALAVFAVLSVACTPDGWGIIATSARNSELSLMVGVGEWMPLWSEMNHSLSLPILIVAGLVFRIVWLRRNRVDVADLAVMLILLLATVLVYRFVVFWGLSLIPLIARTGIPGVDTISLPKGLFRISCPRFGPILAVFAVGIGISVLRPVTFLGHLPIEALTRMREENVTGTIFSDFPFGGPLIHLGHPHWNVAYDGRYYVYTAKEWERFAAIQAGGFALDQIIAVYSPAAFVLHPERNASLAQEIGQRTREWRLFHKDDSVVIFLPRT